MGIHKNLGHHRDRNSYDNQFLNKHFKIENVYDNNNNIIERVFLDIWTNGSISPTEALKSAAQITIDLFTFILENKETEI